MAKHGSVNFNPNFAPKALRDPRVTAQSKAAVSKLRAKIQAAVPVDEGDLKRGFVIRVKRGRDRDIYYVVGTDWKTLLNESQRGTMARQLKGFKL